MSDDRRATRALRDPRGDRTGRHGCGLPGAGSADRPSGGAEGLPGRLLASDDELPISTPLHSRGAERRHPVAPEYRHRARRRSGGGESPAFIAMEYVEGQTLKEILDSPRADPRRRAIDLLVQVARGPRVRPLDGVVHRDVKPGNILVTPDDKVKITDFGIALVNAPTSPITASFWVRRTTWRPRRSRKRCRSSRRPLLAGRGAL